MYVCVEREGSERGVASVRCQGNCSLNEMEVAFINDAGAGKCGTWRRQGEGASAYPQGGGS